jgi:hypothetical protein
MSESFSSYNLLSGLNVDQILAWYQIDVIRIGDQLLGPA